MCSPSSDAALSARHRRAPSIACAADGNVASTPSPSSFAVDRGAARIANRRPQPRIQRARRIAERASPIRSVSAVESTMSVNRITAVPRFQRVVGRERLVITEKRGDRTHILVELFTPFAFEYDESSTRDSGGDRTAFGDGCDTGLMYDERGHRDGRKIVPHVDLR